MAAYRKGLWLTSPAGWLPRTGTSSGTLRPWVWATFIFLLYSRFHNHAVCFTPCSFDELLTTARLLREVIRSSAVLHLLGGILICFSSWCFPCSLFVFTLSAFSPLLQLGTENRGTVTEIYLWCLRHCCMLQAFDMKFVFYVAVIVAAVLCAVIGDLSLCCRTCVHPK